jgi:esterase/lipase superfamily enzyme
VKAHERWYSDRIGSDVNFVRWGDYGRPVLVFPTAGGDAEEIEREGVVHACGGLLGEGRIKLYSCDSVAGRIMMQGVGSPEYRLWLLNSFHDFIYREVVPAIRADIGGADLLIITAGASIGAFNAVATMCRYPDVIGAAVGMSGTYDLNRFYEHHFTDDLYFASPVHFLPNLEGGHLDLLRERFAILTTGSGRWENPEHSWQLAEVLGSKGIPNRVDQWGTEWDHQWPTWLRMLPQYLDELT